MEKEFIPYEQALALKELGFDEPCFMYEYTGDTGNNVNHTLQTLPSLAKNHNQDMLCVSIPLYQQAFRWFREKYGYDVSIVRRTVKAYKFEIQKLVYEENDYFFSVFSFDSHQKAELECLKKLIEIVTNKN